jgi:hypothetical protein
MADKGRPPRGVEISKVLLRIPTTLLNQVDQFKETLEFRINRTDVLTRLIEVGLQTLTQARQPVTQPAPASRVTLHGQGVSAPKPTTQPAIPLALEPAPKTALPVDVPQAAETPEPRKTPMIPTGMQQCPLGHAPYPISQSECPTCVRERQRTQRTVSQQPEGEVMLVPGYEVRPRHSVVTEDVPAPEALAEPVSTLAYDGNTIFQESARQTAIPPYDATKYVLGKLCPQRHEWGTTGQSLLSIHGHTCKECKNDYKRRKRAEKRQGQPGRKP